MMNSRDDQPSNLTSEEPSWAEVRDLFESVVELPDEERPAYLEERAKPGSPLRMAVDRLLAQDACEGQLDEPLVQFQDDRPVPVFQPGDTLGSFTIEGIIASGGMGTVYEAIQDAPRKRVALKTLKSSSNPSLSKRFRFEAEVLGQLQHPAIAHIHEFGVSEETAYIAMEFIGGARDLVRYSISEKLDPRARIELFLRVCDGVHYAHQNGVLHRDLKPSNILVDDDGNPRVIDFGLAVAQDMTQFAVSRAETIPGQVLGTLQYMSPEQLGSRRGGSFDTSTDVYALGVVLFELLAGSPPFDLGTASIFEALKILESDPKPLRSLNADLQEDVEWIVHKAMARDRYRRYGSVSELAQDLRRYLEDIPVLAGPPSGWYRLKKAVRRHRGAVGAMAAVGLALIAGLTGTLIQLGARNEQYEVAEETLGFLDRMFSGVDPAVALGEEITVRDVLEQAREDLDSREDLSLRARLRLLMIVGKAYAALSDPRSSSRFFTEAWELDERDSILDREDRLGLLNSHVASSLELGDLDRARPLIAKASRWAREWNLSPHLVLAAALHEAQLLTMSGQPRESLALMESWNKRDLDSESRRNVLKELMQAHEVLGHSDKVLEIASRLDAERIEQDPHHPEVLEDRRLLASALTSATRLGNAIEILEELRPRACETFAENHPFVLGNEIDLAYAFQEAGEGAKSRSLTDIVWEKWSPAFGRETREHLEMAFTFGSTLVQQGRLARAEELYRSTLSAFHRNGLELALSRYDIEQALATVFARTGKRDEARLRFLSVIQELEDRGMTPHWVLGKAQMHLAGLELMLGRLESSHAWEEKAVENFMATVGPESLVTRVALRNLAVSRIELGELEKAREVLEPLVADLRARGANDLLEDLLDAELALAWLYRVKGQYKEAETLMRDVYKRYCRAQPEESPVRLNAAIHFVQILAAGEKDEEALELAKYVQEQEGYTRPELAWSLARVMIRQEMTNEAKSLLEQALIIARQNTAEDHPLVAMNQAALGECLIALGQFEEAELLILDAWDKLETKLGAEHWQTRWVEAISDRL